MYRDEATLLDIARADADVPDLLSRLEPLLPEQE